MFCPKCGREGLADANFCMGCGAGISGPPPFAPPSVSAGQGRSHGKPKRPWLVWAISLFYLLSSGWILLSFVLIYSGKVPMSTTQRLYFSNLTPLDFIGTVFLTLLSLTAAIFLFFLERRAVTVLAVTLLCNIAYSVVHALTTTWLDAIGGPGLIGMVLGWGGLLAILLYSRRLAREGILT